MSRIAVAALLGGIVLFVWGALSHMALGLYDSSFSQLPREEALLTQLKADVTVPGLYFFPWMDPAKASDTAYAEAWEQKAKEGPSGLLVYRPRGGAAMTTPQLLVELASNVGCALVAAFLLALLADRLTTYFSRVVFVALLGLLPVLSISVSYWNWYGFPMPFLVAEAIDNVAGFALMGMAIAAVLRPGRA